LLGLSYFLVKRNGNGCVNHDFQLTVGYIRLVPGTGRLYR